MIGEVIVTVKELVRPKIINFMLLIIVILFSVIFESFGFALIIPLMESLLNTNSETTVGKMFAMMFGFAGLEMTVTNTAVIFAVIITAKNILKVFREYLKSSFAYGIKADIMENITLSYLNMPLGNFIKYKHGVMVNNIITETQNTAMGIIQLTEFITGLIMIPMFVSLTRLPFR